ncbi:MAG: hypothetical protein ABMA64_26065, partial [Myxococcota bacterium]
VEPPAAEAPRGAVGGSLAGWGAVPLATEAERRDGTAHLWGQLQVWTTAWDQDVSTQADPATYGDPEADPGFSLRRARFGFDGFAPMGDRSGRSQFDYAFAVGVGAPYDVLSTRSTAVELVDAFGRWALPTGVGVTSVALGLQRVPFSRDAMISSADQVFEEAAVATEWLAPSREAGGTVSQSIAFGDGPDAAQILVRAGAYNGGSDWFGDAGTGLLAAARAELVLGDVYRTWSPTRDPAIGLGVAALRDDDLSTRTTAVEGDLLARYSIVTATVELISSTVGPTDTTVADPAVVVDTPRLGMSGQLSVWIPLPHDGIEVAARYATFDDDTAFENSGDVGLLHLGATWRNVAPRVDLGAGFVHRTEPAVSPNDTIRVWAQIRPQVNL